jgi:SAM-dependent methyltransferase
MIDNKADISSVRDFWNRRPCNVRHGTSPVGTKEYFEQVKERKYFVEPHIPAFSEFSNWKGLRVLEIGCGIGTAAASFAEAGALYTGVDLSEESVSLAKRRFEVFNLSGEFFVGNAEELHAFLPSQQFDLIYSFGVIHHSPNPRAIIESVLNYTHDKTELRLMVYAKNSWKNIMIEAGFDQPEAQTGCPIAFTYDRSEIPSLVKGFRVLDIRQEHIFPYVIEKYVQYQYDVQPWFKAMPEAMFKALEGSLGWHMLVKAVRDTGDSSWPVRNVSGR